MTDRLDVEKIFIIDDEIRMGESISALLSDAGYSVTAFHNPVAALEKFSAERVDLVITDIKMPQMDGIEILKKVKEADETVPVILMTAFASLNTAVEAISKGAYDYLVKPVEYAHLELAVKRALEKRRSDLSRSHLVEVLREQNLRLERHVNELNALYEAGTSIGSAANPKELLNKIVELAARVTEARVGSVMLLDEAQEYLTIAAAIGLNPEIIANTRLAIGSSIAGFVAQHAKPLIVDDVENDDQFKRMNKERYGAASLICAPLQVKNRVLGVINMANKKEGGRFTHDDLRLLATFAAQVAVTVDNANQFERNRRRLVEFQILHELSAELPKIKTMNQFRGLLVEKLNRVFKIDYSLWLSYDDDAKTLIPESASGVENIPLTDSGGIDLGKVTSDNLVLAVPEIDQVDFKNVKLLTEFVCKKISQNKRLPQPKKVNMAIPILESGELAVVLLFGADAERPYDTDDESLARLVISQAGLLFEREKSLLNATRLVTMGNMISEISHDLRKPLTSIKGTLQLIRQKWPDLFEKSEYFKSAEEEIQRMNQLVRELVD
ncbi:MAG: response regulator, partial [Candidatus Zixiibacteriota bacterium]